MELNTVGFVAAAQMYASADRQVTLIVDGRSRPQGWPFELRLGGVWRSAHVGWEIYRDGEMLFVTYRLDADRVMGRFAIRPGLYPPGPIDPSRHTKIEDGVVSRTVVYYLPDA